MSKLRHADSAAQLRPLTHDIASVAADGDTASGKNKDTENFPVGSFLIRADLRPHIHAFYNFARAADDISDHPLMEPAQKLRRLNLIEAALTGGEPTLSGPLSHTRMIADLRASLTQTGVTAQHCLDLLQAFKRDATQLRYRDWDDLLDYCRYSAAPVGRHVLALHCIGQEAWPANDALCGALQIINHAQDCADDYRELDRVYIPQDMLNATGAVTADLSRPEATEALRITLTAMLDKVAAMMPLARQLPRFVPDKRLKLETAVIGALADRLIKLLRRRDPLCDNVKLGKLTTLGALMAGCKRAWL